MVQIGVAARDRKERLTERSLALEGVFGKLCAKRWVAGADNALEKWDEWGERFV
jgi:hypothetical protein